MDLLELNYQDKLWLIIIKLLAFQEEEKNLIIEQ